ncbi:hypothetical protein H9L21_01640 [Aeromicrobium senzhongii]|uniref:SCP domain-containing protein n=1 Tax=Aeromicrobium senzhongii TaxID=2663859 RepID=A0ABX6STG0_9ACTN|nr:hypothetical protein [Aeromicrobium senzhongii]MTB88326.1 hypothetical protein [Aeromicrobium senzhongii]QNL94698.1 hypothetical protein H9L21_01640 [Aeromicrobium senzhongii]
MGHIRHIGPTLAVGLVVTVLIGGTVVVAQERSDSPAPAERTSLARPAAAKKPALRLAATPKTITRGATVSFRLRTSTKHPRAVRLQRWDPARKAWRTVTKRTVRATTTIRLKPTVGTFSYRAQAPRIRHQTGGRKHTHAAAKSTTVKVTVREVPRTVPSRPAVLTADEKALLADVRAARATYARADVQGARDLGAEACLTTYARDHARWMATTKRAVDPGAAAHRAAGRPLPAASCPGRTVQAVTHAIGVAGTTAAAVDLAVDTWLASPYGETGRLLSACHRAPGFEYGVAVFAAGGTRYLTVLVSSDASATTKSGAC